MSLGYLVVPGNKKVLGRKRRKKEREGRGRREGSEGEEGEREEGREGGRLHSLKGHVKAT